MKWYGVCASLLLSAIFLVTMIEAYPLEDADSLPQTESGVWGDFHDSEAAKNAAYDDEIISHVVDIVNHALDALQS